MNNETYFREMWRELARTGSDSKESTIVCKFEDRRRLDCGACEEVKKGLYGHETCWCVRCPTFSGEDSEKVLFFQCEQRQTVSPYYFWRLFNEHYSEHVAERKRWAAVIANMPWRTLRPRLAWLKFLETHPFHKEG